MPGNAAKVVQSVVLKKPRCSYSIFFVDERRGYEEDAVIPIPR